MGYDLHQMSEHNWLETATNEGFVEDSAIVLPITNVAKMGSCMSRLVRILTAVVLAVHLMVGCCWHHAHACESMGDVQPAHGQCPDSPDSGADHSHHGPHNCQGNPCSFVLSSSTISNSFAQASPTGFILLLNDQHPLVGIDSEQHFFSTGWIPLPVRLHLAHQVMLI